MRDNIKYNLEQEISKAIHLDNRCVVRFEYSYNMGFLKHLFSKHNRYKIIRVFTDNPKTQESFLLKEVECENIYNGLSFILNYVNNHKKDYSSFTIEWAKKGKTLSNISYFYCHDAKEALDKFYFNKERDEYIVYSLKINPIS